MGLTNALYRLRMLGQRPTRYAAGAPSSELATALAMRCRRILALRIAPFFLQAAVGNGGYLEDEKDGRFFSRGEKFVVMQARYLWFFSLLIEEGIEPAHARQAADRGYRFITTSFHDQRYGGYATMIADDGTPRDSTKIILHQGFVLFALSRYANATGVEAARTAAIDLFEEIVSRGHDAGQPGYQEVAEEDWRPRTTRAAIDGGWVPGSQLLGTALHLLEAMSEHMLVNISPAVPRHIGELIDLIPSRFAHPDGLGMINALWPDGSPVVNEVNGKCLYGHDLELVWLMLAASRAIKRPVDQLTDWARRVTDNALTFGFDQKFGGFYSSGAFGQAASDRTKIWWVQAEAMVNLLEMYRLTGDDTYFRAFVQTLDFFERNFFTADGGCWGAVNRYGRPAHRTRASLWQGPYHSGRSMARCARLLESLA